MATKRDYTASETFQELKYKEKALKAIKEFEETLAEWEGDEYASSENRDALGQFYTPPDLASSMIETAFEDMSPEEIEEYLQNDTVFDPTAGSGNLSAAEWAYGWNPNHIYANELDPDIVEKRLKPRFKKLGIPRENIFPWPVHTRKYGKMGDEIPEERIREIYNEYAEAHPDLYERATKGKNKGQWKPKKAKEGEKAGEDFKKFKDNLWAGNILNPPYAREILDVGPSLDKVRDLAAKYFEAEDNGDIESADELYKQILAKVNEKEETPKEEAHYKQGDMDSFKQFIKEQFGRELNEEEEIKAGKVMDALNEALANEKFAPEEAQERFAKAFEKVIEEHPEFAEFLGESTGEDDLAEEASQITDDSDERNDEVRNDVVESAITDLAKKEETPDVLANYVPSSRQTYENLLNNYKDYIYKSPDEFANWPLQRTENDYIRNRLEEMLPPSVLDLLAMRRWDSEEHGEHDSFWSPASQYYDFALEDALANTGLQWNGEKFLPGSDDEWESNISWEDIRRMDQETKGKLTDYILDHYAGDVEDLMHELPEMMKEWKYDWLTKKGNFKGSWDDFIRSYYPTEEDKLYDKLQEEYPETNPGDSMFGRAALTGPARSNETPIETSTEPNGNQQPITGGEQLPPQSNDTANALDRFPINLSHSDYEGPSNERPITPFQDYAMGMKSKEMEDAKAKLQQDLQAGNAQEVEKAIETQKVTPEDIPQESPLHKEAQQVTDGDKRTTEVNNQAVQKAIKQEQKGGIDWSKVHVYQPGEDSYHKVSDEDYGQEVQSNPMPAPQTSYNVPFERFEQLSPEEQRMRVRFNEKYNMDPEMKDALHEFSDELDRADIERARAQAADDYMDYDEKGELAAWMEDNLPKPPEEEEEEKKEVKKPRTPADMHGADIQLSGGSSFTPDTPQMPESRTVGSAGGHFLPMQGISAGGGSVSPVTVGSTATPQSRPDSTYSRAGGGAIPPSVHQSAPRGFGSVNDAPHSNGTTSSGAVNYTQKSTNYTAPASTAPKLAMLGHTSEVAPAGAALPQLGLLGRNGNPKELLIAQLEGALNQLAMKDPELVEKLGFGHKYKHWDYNGITLEELSPNDLNELLKKVQSLN